MDDETFRDELVTFSLSTEGSSGGGGSSSGRSSASPSLSMPASSSATAADAEPSINPVHRPRLLPIVIRLVYGRLSASGSRGRAGGHGGPAARRVAVLAFLSSLRSEELTELFSLMVRPFLEPIPSSTSLGVGVGREEDIREQGLAEWDDVAGGEAQAREVLERAAGVNPERLLCVPASRQAGFLKMVKEVARQLGQKALPFVETLLGLVLSLLEHSNVVSETERRSRGGEGDSFAEADGKNGEEDEEDAMDEEDEQPLLFAANADAPSTGAEVNSKGRIAPGALRTLCLRALSELFSQYATTFDFVEHQDSLWPALVEPIARLPASTVGAVRAPALLALAEKLTESEALLPMFSPASGKGGQALVPAVLDCISAGSASGRAAGPAVVGSALTFVERLLRYDEGSILSPHLNHLISNFAARLSVTGTSGKGVGGGGGLDSHTEQGLTILAKIAQMATSGPLGAAGGGAGAVDASSMSTLVALLVPSLQPDRRASDEAKSSILRTVLALARRVDSPGARRAWPSLSRLLGPAGARPSGMAAPGPRGELVGALKALASRPDLRASAGPAVSLVAELNALDPVALDEPDFSRAVPAYNSLSEGTGWADVVAAGSGEAGNGKAGRKATRKVGGEDAMAMEGEREVECEDEAAAAVAEAPLGGLLAAAPVAQHCFHSMHDQEVAIRGAAGAALKRLAREVAARERASAAARGEGRRERCPWKGLMRTVLMPGLRAGMACRTEIVRKGYISLLRETVSAYQGMAGGREGLGGAPVAAGAELGSSSVVPTDLWVLARADDPESDFFLNACHMQVHRRARALAKARKAIEDAESAAQASAVAVTTTNASGVEVNTSNGLRQAATDAANSAAVNTTSVGSAAGGASAAAPLSANCPFRVSTLVHFLLPLALHPLHEAAKSAEAGLVGQAVLLAGAVARHLPWTHYNSALRGLIQQVAGGGESDSPEKERAMIGALCGVLDGFHFALLPPEDEAAALQVGDTPRGSGGTGGGGRGAVVAAAAGAGTGDAVWRAVNGRLLGSLRSLLTKEVRGKSGGKEKVLRAPVALGMLNLVRRLPPVAFKLQLQPLMMTVCQSLKSRDSNARDTARDTLAKMARDLGPEYLQQVGGGWVGGLELNLFNRSGVLEERLPACGLYL